MVFRVATYNVHKCKGMDWRVNSGRIADVIAHLQADILTTQEVLYSQAEDISVRLGIPFIFGSSRQHAGERYGNALFTKLRVVSSENYDLSVSGREQRQCMRASLLLAEGVPINFFAFHLGTSYFERRKQAKQLISSSILSSPHFPRHHIIAGDLNEWTRGLATQLLTKHFEIADITTHLKRRATYPGVAPFLHLDHIYYDREFQLREMHLYRTRLSLAASDHLPLVATFSATG